MQTQKNMQLLKQKSVPHMAIDINGISVQPQGYVNYLEFLQSLQFSYITHEYLQNMQNELNFYLYLFKVTHNERTWTIRRTVKEFQVLEKAVRNDPFYIFKSKDVQSERIEHSPTYVQNNLNLYLQSLLKEQHLSNALLRFLEISYVQYGNVQKYKETFIMKKAGGRYGESKCARCGTLWGKWDKRYLCITGDGVLYTKGADQQNSTIREALSYDYNFTVKHGQLETGNEQQIIIQTTTRILVLMALNITSYFDILHCLQTAIQQSPYTKLHRFGSFAPVRNGAFKWYVDGNQYYIDLFDEICKTKRTIYITDWWLSPEFHLKRPVNFTTDHNRQTRLDLLLKRKADEGIQILIILYNEPTIALNNDSLHSKQHLESLSQNIKVLRHPSQAIPFLYSHHEKMVVLDSKIGFMGGLDLCFGRMDNSHHALFEPSDNPLDEFWPGIDFANSRVKDFINVKQYEQCLLNDKQEIPRMPWHDIALKVQGEQVMDMAKHFVQYWNYVTINLEFHKRDDQLLHAVEQAVTTPRQSTNGYTKMDDTHEIRKSKRSDSLVCFEQGPYAAYIKQLETEQAEVQVEHEKQALSRSHTGFTELELDSTIKRREQTKQQQKQPKKHRQSCIQGVDGIIKPELLQILKGIKIDQDEEVHYTRMKKITHSNAQEIIGDQQQYYNPTIFNTDRPDSQVGSCVSQLLRSASKWSIGVQDKNTELSIQLAYLELISNAKQYIYIENQFFISASAGPPVKNQISTAIINRIKQAKANNEKFKVIVFLPLLPGFEGEIDDSSAAVLKVQLHWEYCTISRGGNSILEQLSREMTNPQDYIEFYSLRTHALSKTSKTPVTEIIYIHSKLMIVDESAVIIGSANINDRSLMGSRDSEIAMIIEDQTMFNSKINGQSILVNEFAHSLRTNLYMEHFGLSYEEVQDPLSDVLTQKMREIAARNTEIYREVFACYPDDTVQSIDQLKELRSKQDISKYNGLCSEIVGHAVQFPLNFLCNENLKIGIFNKEYFCPEINFT